MDNFLLVFRQVLVLFALMGVGAAARKLKWIDGAAVKGLVNILVIVVTPCLVIGAFQRPFEAQMMKHLGLAFVVVAAVHAVAISLAYLFVHGGQPETRGVLRVAAAFSNAGFMGLPLEEAILGPEGVFFGIVYVAIFNLFIWSWGMMQIRGGSLRDMTRGEVVKMLFNPGFIGLALGLPLFIASVTLPGAVAMPVAMLGDLNTPLAMIVIGFYLAGADLRPLLRSRSAYLATLVRLVIFPLSIIGLMFPFRHILHPTMMLAVAIAASAPAAALNSMLAAKYGKDVDSAVGIVSGTTLLSIFTMPPVIALAMELLA
jgi:hypothetical protein